ncbi:hypothetical protein BC831DRAFT_457722 [Entophlyctis helioformis]|nr:hypothetical protein BC831DRAFT_457722 [Entophlyctis helioformis]
MQSAGSVGDILDDPAVFDMVWSVFEHGAGQRAQGAGSEADLSRLIVELDLAQVHSLLKGIHRSISSESPSSVRFALLLNFKRTVLDAILKIWPLHKLHDCITILHPMECVYMILNSTFVLSAADSDAVASLFAGDFERAYTVFRYILLWINWKIHDPADYDVQIYETYFNDYSRDERKRVMSSIGSDILKYIETHPEQMMQTVVASFAEIVPLLEGDHLIIFWKFFKNFRSHEQSLMGSPYTIEDLYSKLTSKQLRRFLLYQHSMSPMMLQTPYTPAGTPSSALSVVSDIAGWETLCSEIYTYIAHCYETSTEDGDRLLGESADIFLATSVSTQASPFHQEISPADKILHFARSTAACLVAMLSSSILVTPETRPLFLRNIVLHWALFEPLRHTGFQAILDLARLHSQVVASNGANFLALHADTLQFSSLPINESLAKWIQELGETHPFTPPLSNLCKAVQEAIDAEQDMDTNLSPSTSSDPRSDPSGGAIASLLAPSLHASPVRHPLLNLKTQIHQMPSLEEVHAKRSRRAGE